MLCHLKDRGREGHGAPRRDTRKEGTDWHSRAQVRPEGTEEEGDQGERQKVS